MRRLPTLAAVLCAAALTGCATLPASEMSYADPGILPGAAKTVAQDMASEVARLAPPAQTTLVVAPAEDQSAPVPVAVNAALRAKGFAVTTLAPPPTAPANNGAAPPPQTGVRLRYLITFGGGLVLSRVEVAKWRLARGYTTDGTAVAPSGPWSAMELPQ
ncbi:MAG: hypothetical protein KGH84_04425 [Paracoccaceae bacterium]|nr:hypothetical protein [Paracoccaceae bacterium]